MQSRKCAGLELIQAPIRCAVSIYHRMAEKNSLTIQDLYGEDFMLIQRGWNQDLDTLRDDLWQLHPQVNIVDFDFFSLEVYNRCENSNAVLITIDPWAGIHPLLKVLPMDWDYKMSFGLLHSPKPSPAVRRLLDATRSIYNGGSSCLINRDVTTNNVTDTSNPLTVQQMRQACKDILYTGVNSCGHAPENIDTGPMSWQIILIAADVALAVVVVFLEIAILKAYKKKSQSAAETTRFLNSPSLHLPL